MQLHSAKQQVLGNLALGRESNAGRMLGQAKSLMFLNKINTTQELFTEVNAITAEQLIDIANEIYDPKQFSELLYN